MGAEKQYLLEEYKYHSQKMGETQALRWTFQRFALTGTLAFFAFITYDSSVERDNLIFDIIVWFPFIFNLFGFLSTIGLNVSVQNRAEYVIELENLFLKEGEGWEHFRIKKSQIQKPYLFRPAVWVNYVFWILLSIGSAIFASFLSYFVWGGAA